MRNINLVFQIAFWYSFRYERFETQYKEKFHVLRFNVLDCHAMKDPKFVFPVYFLLSLYFSFRSSAAHVEFSEVFSTA